MTTQPDYPTDKLVIKYPLCNGAVGGLIMGALAMHNELRFTDNLLDIVFGAVGLVLVFMVYGARWWDFPMWWCAPCCWRGCL